MKWIIACFMLSTILLNPNSIAQAQDPRRPSQILAVRLDLNPNNDLIANSDAGSIVTIIDAQTRMVLNTLPVMSSPTVLTTSWNPDGTLLAVGGTEGVRVIDIATGQDLQGFQVSSYPVYTVAWSPDGNRLVSSGEDTLINVWDVADGTLITSLDGHDFRLAYAQWSPDGTRLATVNANIDERFSLRTWDMVNYQPLAQFDASVLAEVIWSADGTELIVANTIIGIYIFDAELAISVTDGIQEYAIGPVESFGSIALHPTDTILAIGSFHQPVIYLWDIVADQLLATLEGHTDFALAMDWHPDGDRLVSVSLDGTLRLWDATSGQQIDMIEVGAKLYAVNWHPDGQQLAYGGETSDGVTGIFKVIQFPTANAGPDQTLITDSSGFATVTLDGSASFDPDGEIISYVWILDGMEIATGAIVLDVAWSPNGDLIAMIDDSGTLNVTLSDQSTPVFQFARPVMLHEAAAVWSPQGDRLAAGIGNRMYIWDVVNWQLLHDYEVGLPSGFFTWGPTENIPEGVQTITWSTDGRYVVVGTYSYETSVWDTQEEQLIFREGDLSGGGPGRVWLDDDGWMGDGATRLNIFSNEIVVPSVEDIQYRFGGSAEGGTTEPRPDNTQIAWGNDTGFLLIYDLNTLRGINAVEVTESIPPARRRAISDISWDGTWNFIAAASRDGELYVVDLAASEVTSLLKLEGRITAVDWNPQTNEILYAGVSASGQSILSIVDVSNIVDGTYVMPPTDPATPIPMTSLNRNCQITSINPSSSVIASRNQAR